MKPSDREAFLEVVIGFCEIKGKQLSAPALELYWRSMQDWGLDEFREAANHLVKTCTFMPTPKDFEDLRKAGRPTTGEAWTRALRHAASSAYRSGLLGDELTDRAVAALGGYGAIAMTDTDKLGFLERRFISHYEALSDASDVRQALPQVAGRSRLPELPNG